MITTMYNMSVNIFLRSFSSEPLSLRTASEAMLKTADS